MDIEKHCYYVIKEEFFEKFSDKNLKSNPREIRRQYLAFKESNGLIWMIPGTKQIEKIESLLARRESRGQGVDIAHVFKIGGEKTALVISDMFPITENYILRYFTVDGNPLEIKDESDQKEINKKAKKIKILIDRGVSFVPTPVDVNGIRKILLEELERDQ